MELTPDKLKELIDTLAEAVAPLASLFSALKDQFGDEDECDGNCDCCSCHEPAAPVDPLAKFLSDMGLMQ